MYFERASLGTRLAVQGTSTVEIYDNKDVLRWKYIEKSEKTIRHQKPNQRRLDCVASVLQDAIQFNSATPLSYVKQTCNHPPTPPPPSTTILYMWCTGETEMRPF